jgi:O-antigen ligase
VDNLHLLRGRASHVLRFLFGGLIFVLVAYLVAPEGYAERLESLTSIFDGTKRAYTAEIGYRANIYRTGVTAFIENPLIGVGMDRFTIWASQRDASMIGTHEVHNAVLSVAANQGLLGLIPDVALLVLTFLDFSRVQAVGRYYRYLKDEELEQIYIRALTAQVGFIGILTVAMFQPGTFWRGIWAFFAIYTALVKLTQQRLAELGAGTSPSENPAAASSSAAGPSFNANPGEFLT